jgi:cyclophilin family peptidyl-prolyl cis-trans isomerase/HEAT repeat protein
MRQVAAFVRVLIGLAALLSFDATAVRAETTTRLAILRAEDRRAPAPEDVATIRSGLHSADAQTVRVAVRALGRLERPSVMSDIIPVLRHRLPEVRAEAANAIGQAAQGWKRNPPADWTAVLDSTQAVLIARLRLDPDPAVRAAIDDTLGRLPYASVEQVGIAEHALLDAARRGRSVTERLGVAQGLFRLTRVARTVQPFTFSAAARATLIELTTYRSDAPMTGSSHAASRARTDETSAVRVRVRRLALEAYLALGPPDRSVIASSLRDPDAQVRRLAARGVAALPLHDGGAMLKTAADDESPIVRIEALRGLLAGGADEPCAVFLRAVGDRSTPVALTALDELSRCGASADAVSVLTRATVPAADLSGAGPSESSRGWHRAAHALVSLAVASPEQAAATLGQFTGSSIWQLRMYAARAAATLKNRDALERLAGDPDDNVREAAIDALAKLYGHDVDAIFVAQLTRTGHQVLRAAALALVGTPHGDLAMAPLQATRQRLIAEGLDNSHDARAAITQALDSLGPQKTPGPVAPVAESATIKSNLDADALRRLASARARVVIRGVGVFELTLLTAQAPASVLRFARLAESGYYNGLTFHRVVPNFVIQGGSPGANEYIGDAAFMRDEVGLSPHVRGAVGVSTRGRDTGDAQIFIDLVDNPRLDHDYTVFAEVRRGIEVVDQILEGDVIDRVDIIP